MYYPIMASLISKKKANKLYYYLVESGRVEGKPRIVNQIYLGTAEKVAALVQERSAPIPLSATSRKSGLPGALWLTAQQSGVFDLLQSIWPPPRSGPSTAHYLLLAAINRICDPGPKTEFPNWYQSTVLESLWQFPPERFSSQAFWDCFDRIKMSPIGSDVDPAVDELDRAQLALLALWKNKQMVSHRLLSYDTTNFYTFVASTNDRNSLAQRGHNKQGRHNLRQVGLSYVLDGIYGLSLCHHVYPGNVADTEEFSIALPRLLRFLDESKIPRDSVTLVFDKGSAALYNTLALDQSGIGWISALPWNQVPKEFQEMPLEHLTALSSDHPGVQACQQKLLVHGKERLCVLKYSVPFLSEQIHSLSTSLSKVTQSLRRLSIELSKPDCGLKERHIRTKISRWLSAQFLNQLIHYDLKWQDSQWKLQFDLDTSALNRLMVQRLGRTVLMTNRMDWTAEQVVAGYSGQQQIEKIFRGLKDGDWLNWGPMYHWTDSKIRIHAFYCMLGISLMNYLHAQVQKVCPRITVEQLKDELRDITQYVLLYPPQGEKGPYRTATIQNKLSLTQTLLADAIGLETLIQKKVGKTKRGR
jgi:transposase